MTLQQSEDFVAYNERSLNTLSRAIVLSQGRFSLILVRCNYSGLRAEMQQRLHQQCPVNIQELVLPEKTKTLYTAIKTELGHRHPQALMVLGLEAVTALDDVLIATNRVRDEFRNFAFPLVLWVNDEILRKLTRLALDFNSWASVPIHFAIDTDALIDLLRQETDTLFMRAMDVGAGRFPRSSALYHEMHAYSQTELKTALKDLESRGQKPDPALHASLQFVLGQDAYIHNRMEEAQNYYEQSLAFWQQEVEKSSVLPDQVTNSHPPYDPALLLERWGCLLFYLGLWWRRQAVLDRSEYFSACRKARDYYQRCITALQQGGRSDLVAKFINALGEVLRRLGNADQLWDELETVAQTAVNLHQCYFDPIRLAYSYGLLADVALSRSAWQDARHYAEQALQVNDQPPDSSKGAQHQYAELDWARQHHRSLYLLLLAQAQQHLQRSSEAAKNLELAKASCNHAYDPLLYTRILEALRSLYYQQGEYLKAFQAKQDQRSIEQQYSLRAFIGAGRLKPERQVINPALMPIDDADDGFSDGHIDPTVIQPVMVAQEIAASGRQQDVNRLMERLSRNDYKLIVMHGQSGVGKSSIVNAGLVPALKQHPIGDRNVLSVVLNGYSDWVKDLSRCFIAALEDQGIQSSLPAFDATLDLQLLIQQFQKNADQRSLLTVLIFDQFEEFFFIHPSASDRRSFFQFLGKCLDLPFVKVVLSLREDYLHYLLECDRLHLGVLTDDILGRDKRYPLGNFSPLDARLVIERLTERSQFRLEEALIDQLVDDLAKELGEVRPIELQVVGVQLQDDDITTLSQYHALGENPKEKLVARFLEHVIEDCGPENKQITNLVLYLLTDEKGTRPLRTLTELITSMSALMMDLTIDIEQITLVLQILVKSGLVMLLPELPTERYQLVHDYLATFIRREQGRRFKLTIKQLADVRKQQKLTQAELERTRKQQRQYLIATGVAIALGIPATGLAVFAYTQWNRAEVATVEALTSLSSGLLLANDQLDALVNGVKAGERLLKVRAPLDVKTQTTGNLLQAVYSIQERDRFTRHSSYVTSVSFRPDGKLLASASADGTIMLWNTNGQFLPLKSYSNRVNSVSFSPNGQLLAAASDDGSVNLWDLTNNTHQALPGHRLSVTSVSFSPNGQLLASASDDGTINLLNLTSQKLTTFKAHWERIKAISFSPDGNTIASASWDGTVKLWNLAGKQQLTLHHKDNAHVTSVNFSPDGQFIASGGWDNTIKLWNREGKLLQTLNGHTDWVKSVGFSRDSKTILSASNDGSVKVWSLDGFELKTLKVDGVTSVSFSPVDTQLFASASADNTVRLWNLTGMSPTLLQHDTPVKSISFSPNKRWIVSASQSAALDGWGGSTAAKSSTATNGQIKLWSLDRLEQRAFPVRGNFTSVSFSPVSMVASAENSTLADGRAVNEVKLWSLDGKILKTRSIAGRIADISFSPDGKTLAIAENRSIAPANNQNQPYLHQIHLWNFAEQAAKSFQPIMLTLPASALAPMAARSPLPVTIRP